MTRPRVRRVAVRGDRTCTPGWRGAVVRSARLPEHSGCSRRARAASIPAGGPRPDLGAGGGDRTTGTGLGRSAAAGHRARLSSGHVVMLLAGALGVLLTLTVLRSADQTRARCSSPRTISRRERWSTTTSVRVARVHADASVLATMFAARSALRDLRGQVVTTRVRSGELLSRRTVRDVDAHAATRVMSIPIARVRARRTASSRRRSGRRARGRSRHGTHPVTS